ncbi:MAG: O-antigen ligase family protein [Bacteroidales bacterium]|nr:O-antigen ligase family protein [Bacteroidales bacterium]
MNIIKPFVVMVIVYYEFSKNSSGLIKLLTICLGLYTLMGLTVVGFDINNEGRLSSVELGNQLPLNIVFLIFFVCLRFSGKEINFTKTILLVVFSLLIISLSGTRKAFGAGMLIIVSTLISYINFKSVKTIIAVLLCVILLFFGYKYMMDNTVMGDRMAESSEVGEKYNTSNIKALNMLGDRTYFYILGWEIFKENPQTGIGLENYRAKTGSLYRIHSEYIVQLAECGIIGSILFLLFYLSIGSKLYKHWRWYPQKRNITWVMIGGFVAIAFINFTAWTYSFPVYFAVFGVIISYIKQIINTSDENSNTR